MSTLNAVERSEFERLVDALCEHARACTWRKREELVPYAHDEQAFANAVRWLFAQTLIDCVTQSPV